MAGNVSHSASFYLHKLNLYSVTNLETNNSDCSVFFFISGWGLMAGINLSGEEVENIKRQRSLISFWAVGVFLFFLPFTLTGKWCRSFVTLSSRLNFEHKTICRTGLFIVLRSPTDSWDDCLLAALMVTQSFIGYPLATRWYVSQSEQSLCKTVGQWLSQRWTWECFRRGLFSNCKNMFWCTWDLYDAP